MRFELFFRLREKLVLSFTARAGGTFILSRFAKVALKRGI